MAAERLGEQLDAQRVHHDFDCGHPYVGRVSRLESAQLDVAAEKSSLHIGKECR